MFKTLAETQKNAYWFLIIVYLAHIYSKMVGKGSIKL